MVRRSTSVRHLVCSVHTTELDLSTCLCLVVLLCRLRRISRGKGLECSSRDLGLKRRVGIDRLVMLFTGKPTIREVLLYPLMKPLASGKDE